MGWRGSFEPPGVFHAGPGLFRSTIHSGGLESAFGQTCAGGFIETFEARAFFDFGLDHLAIHANQKAQAHRAFFFHSPRGAGVVGFFTLGCADAGRCPRGRCSACRGRRRSCGDGHRLWRGVGHGCDGLRGGGAGHDGHFDRGDLSRRCRGGGRYRRWRRWRHRGGWLWFGWRWQRRRRRVDFRGGRWRRFLQQNGLDDLGQLACDVAGQP